MGSAEWVKELERLVGDSRVTIRDCGNGHIQIKGALLVNYYPTSRRRSAYVAGTTKRYEFVGAAQAIKMAKEAPPVAATERKDTRSKNGSVRRKMHLLRKDPRCMWCKHPVSLGGLKPGTRKATLEHIIPLNRGGLDNANNQGLACEECNHERGHDMPELEKKIEQAI